jgi:hypothetical protein
MLQHYGEPLLEVSCFDFQMILYITILACENKLYYIDSSKL